MSRNLDYSPCLKDYILLLRAGCDTTSLFYGKGKTQPIDSFVKSAELQEAAGVFKQPDADIQRIYESGVKLILAYYGTKNYEIDLNKFRYFNFLRNIIKKLEYFYADYSLLYIGILSNASLDWKRFGTNRLGMGEKPISGPDSNGCTLQNGVAADERALFVVQLANFVCDTEEDIESVS